MTLVQLTEITHGDPRPLAVNPDHVMSLRPRKTLTPIDAQQDPRTIVSYNGTILELATGEQHFVTEDFDTVHDLLTPPLDPALAQQQSLPPPPKKSHHKQPPPPPVADSAEDMTALVPE